VFRELREWQLTHLAAVPERSSGLGDEAWAPAELPGCAQTSAFGVSHRELYQELRLGEVRWMNRETWIYRAELQVPKPDPDEGVWLRLVDLEVTTRVHVDGEPVAELDVASGEGEVDLTPWAGRQVTLDLLLLPSTAENNPLQLPLHGRGNGWAPRFRSIGVGGVPVLATAPRTGIADAWVRTRLCGGACATVDVTVRFRAPAGPGRLHLRLGHHEQHVPVGGGETVTARLELPQAQLWWPNGCGEPVLHTLDVLMEPESGPPSMYSTRVGLADLAAVALPGQRPTDPPLGLRVNGRTVFLQGLVWRPLDLCRGHAEEARYERLLRKCRAAGVNWLYLPAEAGIEPAAFYRLAAAHGILVLQGMPLSGPRIPPRDAPALRALERVARRALRHLRRHPGAMGICAGDDLRRDFRDLDSDEPILQQAAKQVHARASYEQPLHADWRMGAENLAGEPAVQVLAAALAGEAPHLPFRLTMPNLDAGELTGPLTWDPAAGTPEHRASWTLAAFWQQHRPLLGIGGTPALAHRATIREVLGGDEEAAVPRSDAESWRWHHAFYAAWDERDTWLDVPGTETAFGPLRRLSDLEAATQFLQAEGLRLAITAQRAGVPRRAGVLLHAANEPWPSLAGHALLDYYERPKPAWEMLRALLAPTVLLLAEQPARGSVRGELWLSHNGPAPFAGHYRVAVQRTGMAVQNWVAGPCAAEPGESVPLLDVPALALGASHTVRLHLELREEAAADPFWQCTIIKGHWRPDLLA